MNTQPEVEQVEPLPPLEQPTSIARALNQRSLFTGDLANLITGQKSGSEAESSNVVGSQAPISHLPNSCSCFACGGSTSEHKTALVTLDDGPIGTTNPIKALLEPGEPRWTKTFPGDDTTVITYSFITGEDSNPNDNFDTVVMNFDQQQQTSAALEEWEDVANIDFQFDPTGNGNLTFGTADLIKYLDKDPNNPSDDPVVAGYAPGNPGDKVLVWLDNNYGPLDNPTHQNPTNQNPIPGTTGFNTLLHEIGHALGLKHPGNYATAGDDIPPGPYLDSNLDDKLYTVMSYKSAQLSGNPVTSMVFDIAAIQYLYGVNNISRSGNNTDSWNAKSFATTIWDNGGIDSIVVNDAFISDIDLGQTNGGDDGPGDPIEPSFGLPITRSFISATGSKSDLVIPNGVVTENVSGSSGVNTISGNAVDNYFNGFDGNDKLNGLDGNDYLEGGFGNDSLDGGVGDDTLSGGHNDDTYIVDSPGDVVVEDNGGLDPGGIDIVKSSVSYTLGDRIENLTLTGEAAINGMGNSLDNEILGNSAINVLDGGVGEDTLFGENGDDVLSGGADNDTLFGDSNKPGIDWLFGGAGDDKLAGGAGDDALYGEDNNDTLKGSSGSGHLDGGSGDDIYLADEFDTIVELFNGGNDTIRTDSNISLPENVENLETLNPQGTVAVNFTGNSLSNQITGNAGNNVLNGLAGDDTLRGLDGHDTLIGEDGNDRLTGGVGNDYLNGGNAAGTDISSVDSVDLLHESTSKTQLKVDDACQQVNSQTKAATSIAIAL